MNMYVFRPIHIFNGSFPQPLNVCMYLLIFTTAVEAKNKTMYLFRKFKKSTKNSNLNIIVYTVEPG